MAGFERWVGKVAVVTGASAGIGADIAKQLAQKGVKVVGLARRKERVEALSKSLSGASGKLYAVQCDVSKEEDIKNAFKWTSDNVGPVHILVNNAGFVNNNNLIDGDTDKWRQVFEVNVIGLLTATREAVKIMRANNIDGHIININSIAGHYDLYFPRINVYPATKHAVTNLTETLRKEFNANQLKIKVTSVSPGAVKTEFAEASQIDFGEMMNHIPFLQSEDITEAVVYALSTKPHVQIHEIMIHPVGEQ